MNEVNWNDAKSVVLRRRARYCPTCDRGPDDHTAYCENRIPPQSAPAPDEVGEAKIEAFKGTICECSLAKSLHGSNFANGPTCSGYRPRYSGNEPPPKPSAATSSVEVAGAAIFAKWDDTFRSPMMDDDYQPAALPANPPASAHYEGFQHGGIHIQTLPYGPTVSPNPLASEDGAGLPPLDKVPCIACKDGTLGGPEYFVCKVCGGEAYMGCAAPEKVKREGCTHDTLRYYTEEFYEVDSVESCLAKLTAQLREALAQLAQMTERATYHEVECDKWKADYTRSYDALKEMTERAEKLTIDGQTAQNAFNAEIARLGEQVQTWERTLSIAGCVKDDSVPCGGAAADCPICDKYGWVLSDDTDFYGGSLYERCTHGASLAHLAYLESLHAEEGKKSWHVVINGFGGKVHYRKENAEAEYAFYLKRNPAIELVELTTFKKVIATRRYKESR